MSQATETPASIDARFEAWDCEQGSVRTWTLGRQQSVLSLVRFLAEKDTATAPEADSLGFSTPMEVTIAPPSLYQPSASWLERFGGTYQVGVYPNVNPDWGSLKREVSTLAEALDVAEEVCADIEERHDLLRAGDERKNREVALSSRGPKSIV